ncbi:MAG: hypothetical protein ACE5FA_04285, partial [Dehalococcoidia bacterium]
MKFPKFRKRKSDAGPEKADQPQQSLPDQKVGSSLGDILAPRGQPPAPAQPPANPGDAILSSAPAQPPANPGDAILSSAP